jgi:hypothetical protein
MLRGPITKFLSALGVPTSVTPTDPLPVTLSGGGGSGDIGDVNIAEVGGVVVDPNLPAVVTPLTAVSATTSVDSSASNGTLLAALATRLHATIYNSDANALCIKYGATATTSDYSFRILGGETWSMPYRYAGIIDGIWESNGSGAAKITSLTSV